MERETLKRECLPLRDETLMECKRSNHQWKVVRYYLDEKRAEYRCGRCGKEQVLRMSDNVLLDYQQQIREGRIVVEPTRGLRA